MVDGVGVSDVRNAKDIIAVKTLLGDRRKDIKILAKLQNLEVNHTPSRVLLNTKSVTPLGNHKL